MRQCTRVIYLVDKKSQIFFHPPTYTHWRKTRPHALHQRFLLFKKWRCNLVFKQCLCFITSVQNIHVYYTISIRWDQKAIDDQWRNSSSSWKSIKKIICFRKILINFAVGSWHTVWIIWDNQWAFVPLRQQILLCQCLSREESFLSLDKETA